ncbi:hypothetical protein [Sphingomonas crocodyli]|uniref:Uncharacterized protein n=1 Tax=Sphingomonas crocodyli TaxID=1979270 RepID=A0A437M085_9SPHN|nr:hypothetical protein [Sphingomonas crocodyli]RVT90924.1 hypothetical protein EOD43_15405 [Sphingomonas crocodyli]
MIDPIHLLDIGEGRFRELAHAITVTVMVSGLSGALLAGLALLVSRWTRTLRASCSYKWS